MLAKIAGSDYTSEYDIVALARAFQLSWVSRCPLI